MDVIDRKVLAHDLATLSRRLRDLARTLDVVVEVCPDHVDGAALKSLLAGRSQALSDVQNEVLRLHREVSRD